MLSEVHRVPTRVLASPCTRHVTRKFELERLVEVSLV